MLLLLQASLALVPNVSSVSAIAAITTTTEDRHDLEEETVAAEAVEDLVQIIGSISSEEEITFQHGKLVVVASRVVMVLTDTVDQLE